MLHAGAGETVHVLADSATVKVGAHDGHGTISLVEVVLAPRGGVPAHTHAGDDETLYVLEGSLHVRVGEERVTLGAGGCLFAPRGTVHAHANPRDTIARVLVISSPAQDASRLFV